MTPPLAHIGGVPVEEAIAGLLPSGFLLLIALRSFGDRVRDGRRRRSHAKRRA